MIICLSSIKRLNETVHYYLCPLTMKKLFGSLMPKRIIVYSMVFIGTPSFAFKPETAIPRVEILTPGMTRTVEITQNYKFPRDYGNFLILILGYGGVSITLRKVDTEGDTIYLIGAGISSAGIDTIFKFGITEVTLTEAVEIGDQRAPYGLLWISSWVDSQATEPPHYYTLVLSF
jgi:hypothetical protein